ncbi:hypothetical protein [Pseudaestuariivita atlantica]|uniref:Uncharacterized protein n=1 Tax=Pseudaestuariivita atlantica TaxID=1317121 RepID=A0A0L1JL53_9RHOB|nr:hypothetical protein [Pseudaestuariivita atlantica]KNG92481.1 hypothetical protein ATO11_17915 [Pseudaestuariivita atlantica]
MIRGVASALILAGLPAMAETVRTGTYLLDADRRAVTLRGNASGQARRAEQVIVSVRRLDGAPVTAGIAGIAARLACGAATPLVSFPVDAPEGTKAMEFLCPPR